MFKVIFTAAVALAMSVPTFASTQSEMKEFAEKVHGPFTGYTEYEGYSYEKIEFYAWPQAMKNRLKEINDQRVTEWVDYVLNSEEFDHLDEEAKQHLIDNAADEWGSPTPLRLDGNWAIYKDGKLIGYVSDFADMVDSAIIQDGSGWVFFVDIDGNVVRVNDWQS